MLSYYSYYTIPQAAALWCKVPPEKVREILAQATEVGRNIYRHPSIPCLEPRCRVLHDAIESDKLPCGRDGRGRNLESQDHVAAERRTLTRQELKEWIAKEFPGDKPAFLFDDIERKTHSAINSDSFQALQVDRDALQGRLDKAIGEYQKLRQEKLELERINQSLQAMVEKMNTPGDRAETTYLNIMAALLEVISNGIPDPEKTGAKIGPACDFKSEAKLIVALAAHFTGFDGMSQSNLQRKFPEAKRRLTSS